MKQRSIALSLIVTSILLPVLLTTSVAQKTKIAGTTITNPTIQASVDLAFSGETILISVGTFPEAVIVSNKNLILWGGWSEDFDGVVGTPSIIDGANTRRPLTFLESSGTVHTLNLHDGGGGLANSWGGGLNLGRTSWVQVANTIIEESESAWAGGGVYVSEDSHLRMIGCSVLNNRAYDGWLGAFGGSFGGGIFVAGSAEIWDATTISYNTATSGFGGGVWVSAGSLAVSNCHFHNNEARNGGTVSFSHAGGIGGVNSKVDVVGSYIEDNRARSFGGGMGFSGCTVSLSRAGADMEFDGNEASDGAGMYLTNCVAVIENTLFWYNTAVSNGGAIRADYSQLRCDGPLGGFNNNEATLRGGAVMAYMSTASFDTVFFGFDGSGGNKADFGGAIDALFSDLTISGGCFSANTATGNFPSCGGGAISFISGLGKLTITNGTGGVGIYSNYAQTVFNGNRATITNGFGGALYCFGETEIYGATFISNSAHEGGAVSVGINVPIDFYETTFAKNYAADRGGAIRSESGIIHAVDCVFSENDTGVSGDGGAISMSGKSLMAYNCHFLNNTSDYGGAIAAWDSAINLEGSGFPFSPYYKPYNPSNGYASLFKENDGGAGLGGALYSWGNTVVVYYTAFDANRAAAGNGAHIADLGSEYDIYGSLFVDAPSGDALNLFASTLCDIDLSTIANNAGAGIRLAGGANVGVSNSIIWDGGDTIVNGGGTYSLGYSDVEGYAGGTVISTNPHFLPNYHLRSMSPCRNVGEPLVLPGPLFRIVYDIDGEPPMGANNDMGFDQFQDTDGDGLPDIIETGTGVWKSEIDTGSSSNLVHSDGDGVPDGEEWVAYTDPSDPNSLFKIIKMWPADGRMHVRWTSGTNSIIHGVHRGGEWAGPGIWLLTPYAGGGTTTNETDFGVGDSGFFYISMER